MTGWIIIGIGALIIIIALVGRDLYNTASKFNDVITEATVIKIKIHTYWNRGEKEEQLIPVLSYVVNGKKYKTEYVPEFHVNMTKQNTWVGKKIKIGCSSHNPEYVNVLSYGEKVDHTKFYIKIGFGVIIVGAAMAAFGI